MAHPPLPRALSVFLKDLDEEIEGRDVLLVEDIVDTGLTLKYLRKKTCRRGGPRSLKIATLLDKPGAAQGGY